MAQHRAHLLAVVAASAVALTVVGTQSGAQAGGAWGARDETARPADEGRRHRRRRAQQGDRRHVRHAQRAGADEGRCRHAQGLPRPHRVGHGRHPQRGHDGCLAQAHGLDQRGLPRRGRPARRPRRPLHHQQLRARPDGAAAAGGRLPAPVRLPRRHRQGVHRQPQGVRRMGPQRSRVGEHLDDHVRQQDVPRPGEQPSGDHPPPRADGLERAGVLLGGLRLTLGGGPRHGVRHPPVPGAALPRHRQPLRGRQRPGAPGRGHLGDRRRPRDHGAGGRRLERHLRQPPRRRQGRAHVGRRQRPGGRDAGLRPDDAHGVRHRDRGRPGRPDHAGARGQWPARRHARRPHRRPRLRRG